MRTQKIYYLPGFRSKGFNNFFEKKGIAENLPLGISPADNLKMLGEFINTKREEGIEPSFIGNSLGGLYAYYVACSHDVKVFLINPLYDVTETNLRDHFIGTHSYHDCDECFEFTMDDYSSLCILSNNLKVFHKNMDHPEWNNVYAVFTNQDELLDHTLFKTELNKYTTVINMDGGHRLTSEQKEWLVDHETFKKFTGKL